MKKNNFFISGEFYSIFSSKCKIHSTMIMFRMLIVRITKSFFDQNRCRALVLVIQSASISCDTISREMIGKLVIFVKNFHWSVICWNKICFRAGLAENCFKIFLCLASWSFLRLLWKSFQLVFNSSCELKIVKS